MTLSDAEWVTKTWKLTWGRNLVDDDAGMTVLLEDCMRLTKDGGELRGWLLDFRRGHEQDRPAWSQFAAYCRAQKQAPPMSFTLRPPIIVYRPDGEAVRITPSRWHECDAVLGISYDDDEPKLDIGDPRVGEHLKRLRAALGGLTKKLRAPESDRFVARTERERVAVVDDPRALRARQAVLQKETVEDVPLGELPF